MATQPRTRDPELVSFLRLTKAEQRAALSAVDGPPVFQAQPYRRRPRPSKGFRKLSAAQRQELLGRESQECGPGVILTRVRAVIEARTAGDPRALSGSLEDLAAAAVTWSERTIADMISPRRPCDAR